MAVHHASNRVGQTLLACSPFEVLDHLGCEIGGNDACPEPCGGQTESASSAGNVEEAITRLQSGQGERLYRQAGLSPGDETVVACCNRVPCFLGGDVNFGRRFCV